MNRIAQEQNNSVQIERLAAQRQLYSDAKRIQFFYIIINIFAAVIWSFVVIIFPKFNNWWTIWGFIATILGIFVFEPLQKNLKEQAAIIQQMFDSAVLQMDWDRLNTRYRVASERISEKCHEYNQGNNNSLELENWYSESVSEIPLHYARLICQRINCWWDGQLRAKYIKWMLIVLVSLSITLLLIGLVKDLSLKDFLLDLVIPLSPLYYFGINQYREHKETIRTLYNLRQEAENYWQQSIYQSLSPDEITELSYSLQKDIHNHRCSNPLIFDWLYKIYRDKNEEQMDKSTEDFIEEYKSSIR
ncbi:MAG: S-4TM family putative pore-forming effector [Cyanobacteria bacterium P01_A01_bin.40]